EGRRVAGPLGGWEGGGVGAGGEIDRLADRALALQEGDLTALRCGGIIEGAAVAGQAGTAAKGPGRAGRVVSVSARRQGGRLEARVGERRNQGVVASVNGGGGPPQAGKPELSRV